MTDFVSKRTNASQSFDLEELKAILETEAKRPIIEEKRFSKLIDYSLVKKWLDLIGIKTNPFLDRNDTQKVVEAGNLIKEDLSKLTLDKLKNNDQELLSLFKKITSYLSQEDQLEKSDFIFVFGSKNLGRINKAIELYKNGWAPKIWITGGHPIYQDYEPEAETFKKYAITNGVPEKYILTEPDSITIADNVRRSLNKMDGLNLKFNKIILVTSWFVQKRSWMTMEKYLPVGTKIINISASITPDSQVLPTNWHQSEYGINLIFNEFLKMRIHDSLVMNRII